MGNNGDNREMGKQVRLLPLIVIIFLLPLTIWGDKTLNYEPAIVELTGKVSKARARHPNGTWINYVVFQLEEPATVTQDNSNKINVLEQNVREIQLFSRKSTIYKKIEQSDQKTIRVKGTLFHGHTTWHMRAVLMDVLEIIE